MSLLSQAMEDVVMLEKKRVPDGEGGFTTDWAEGDPHICSETMRPLKQYSATYISHIMTRGAHPEMAHDPRNVNILCFEMHNRWENGNRSSMRIYAANMLTIEQLKKEYGKINHNYTVENGRLPVSDAEF